MKKRIFGLAALAAAMCFGATTKDGVTKERRGVLGPNDTVVTDVDATGIVEARTYTKAEIDRRIATNAPVRSVNGKSGAVTLGAGDVGALPNNRDDLKASANFRNAVWDVQIRGGGCDTNTVDALANSAVVTNALTVATTNRVTSLESSKANRPELPVTANNLAALTADGNLADSEVPATRVPTAAKQLEWDGKRDRTDLSLDTWIAGEGAPESITGQPQWIEALKCWAWNWNTPEGVYESFRTMNASDPDDPGPIELYDELDIMSDRHFTATRDRIAKESQLTSKADRSMISATNSTFSNAVLAVGLNIDTNSVAVLNEIAATFGGFPIEGTATTVGGLLAALAAAAAWLKKNKVGSFESVGGASATVKDGVAKLHDFFTESNSLLNGRLAYSRNATDLKDRAFNTLSFDGTEYNLSTALAAVTPTASGQPRDLLIVATAAAATTISFTAGTIKGDKPTIDGSGTWLITLTEYAADTWYCRQIKMEDAA